MTPDSTLFSTDDLAAATDAGIITARQHGELRMFFAARLPLSASPASAAPRDTRKFDLVHVLWYAGALVVIGAMGLFSTVAFSQMGGAALTVIALVYAGLFTAAGHYLWTVKGLRTPGGLLIAVAVTMAPLAVYGVQDAMGWWDESGKPGTVRDVHLLVKGGWLAMEIAAIAATALALRVYRFPFLVMIAAFALWYMSMDIVPWMAGFKAVTAETRRIVSVWFGLGVLIAAFVVNVRQRTGDFAFWLYLAGVLAFWGGISMGASDSNLAKAVYCAMNVGFLGLSVILARRVFAVFGTIGIAIYLGDLAGQVFKDSLMFPFALSLIGIAIIAAGLSIHRHQDALKCWLDRVLPDRLKRLHAATNAMQTQGM